MVGSLASISALAGLDIDRRALFERLARTGARAREHQIDAVAGGVEAGLCVKFEQASLGTALGPYPEQFFRHALCALTGTQLKFAESMKIGAA